MNPVLIVIVIIIVLVLLYAWSDAIKLFKKSDKIDDSIEQTVEELQAKIREKYSKPITHISNFIIEEPKPYSDETHFFFKGKNIPTIAKGNYLPLIPVVIDGNQRLRFTTKSGFDGIMKLIDLETAVYYPAVETETLKTKDSTNG